MQIMLYICAWGSCLFLSSKAGKKKTHNTLCIICQYTVHYLGFVLSGSGQISGHVFYSTGTKQRVMVCSVCVAFTA